MPFPPRSPDQRRRPPVRMAIVVALAAALVLVLATAVMLLWNAVLVPALRVGTLDYWQALGLLVLCRILFGNFGRGPVGRGPGTAGWSGPGAALREKWSQMTPEQRAGFRDHWHSRRQACRPSRGEPVDHNDPRQD